MLAARIITELQDGKKVLWLVCGGSNISISVAALRLIKAGFPKLSPEKLSITLTDERYGPVGHFDSNWKQLADAGFNFALMRSRPVLTGLGLDETVNVFEGTFENVSHEADIVIGQFGIGADSHIAGALPGSPAIDSKRTAVAYKSGNFTRITLTLAALSRLDVAYAFVFGESKKKAVDSLRDTDASISEQPVQVLKKLREAHLIFGA
jgi:6-phosphogluconolactonase/glucosamine-6-phosphate isomerase/deaminase